MSTYLLDANVVIAATIAEHEHHERVSRWLTRIDSFAVCPAVEGALVRFVLRLGGTAETARAILDGVHGHPRSVFVPDDLSYRELTLTDLRGHRQVTDVYLAGRAAALGGRLATLDEALAALRPHQTHLIPDQG